MVGFIYPTGGSSASNLPVAIVDLDAGYHNSTVASQAFTSALQQINGNTDMMKLTTASSAADIKNLIQRGDIEGGIVIPSNFSASLAAGKQGTVVIITD